MRETRSREIALAPLTSITPTMPHIPGTRSERRRRRLERLGAARGDCDPGARERALVQAHVVGHHAGETEAGLDNALRRLGMAPRRRALAQVIEDRVRERFAVGGLNEAPRHAGLDQL